MIEIVVKIRKDSVYLLTCRRKKKKKKLVYKITFQVFYIIDERIKKIKKK
jgi:hypothetical protein